MKRFVNATFVLLILLVLGLMASCQKDPQPEPTPETPVEPKNDTILWDLMAHNSFSPSAELVQEHLDKPNTKNVVIHIFKSGLNGENGIGQPMDLTYYAPALFFYARDYLTRNTFAADSTRTYLYTIIEVVNVNATGHGWDETGITPEDKAWFERHGAQFVILDN